jgi:hypothetical protein
MLKRFLTGLKRAWLVRNGFVVQHWSDDLILKAWKKLKER